MNSCVWINKEQGVYTVTLGYKVLQNPRTD